MRLGWSGWSFEISDAWTVSDDPECLTLTLSDDAALQASAAYKADGDVLEAELEEFATSNADWGLPSLARCGDFEGIFFDYVDDEIVWWRWFLRNGNVIVFVTYNGTAEATEREGAIVRTVVSTLSVEPQS